MLNMSSGFAAAEPNESAVGRGLGFSERDGTGKKLTFGHCLAVAGHQGCSFENGLSVEKQKPTFQKQWVSPPGTNTCSPMYDTTLPKSRGSRNTRLSLQVDELQYG